MPSYEIRFRREPDQPIQSFSFDAENATEALMILPRDTSVAQGELWSEGTFLFSIVRAENDFGMFWIISPDSS